MPKEGFTVMAQYNHEILVNYLRDVYSLELLCCKIQGKVNYLNSEIHRGRQTISEFNHSSMPTLEVESVHDSRDLGRFIFLYFFVAFRSCFASYPCYRYFSRYRCNRIHRFSNVWR